MYQVCGETYPKTGKIIWINMRQEPDVYVNGEPVCARWGILTIEMPVDDMDL